jgi:hypothetical protein
LKAEDKVTAEDVGKNAGKAKAMPASGGDLKAEGEASANDFGNVGKNAGKA